MNDLCKNCIYRKELKNVKDVDLNQYGFIVTVNGNMTMTNNKLTLDGDAIVCENNDKSTVRIGNGSGLIVNCSAYEAKE